MTMMTRVIKPNVAFQIFQVELKLI